jgi:hypothetical protein
MTLTTPHTASEITPQSARSEASIVCALYPTDSVALRFEYLFSSFPSDYDASWLPPTSVSGHAKRTPSTPSEDIPVPQPGLSHLNNPIDGNKCDYGVPCFEIVQELA